MGTRVGTVNLSEAAQVEALSLHDTRDGFPVIDGFVIGSTGMVARMALKRISHEGAGSQPRFLAGPVHRGRPVVA